MPKQPCNFTMRDVTRAFKAAQAAGVEARIDLTPGRISIVPIMNDVQAKTPDEWDDALAKKPVSIRS